MAVPNAKFQGKISEIFVNDAQILIALDGKVDGPCTGSFGPYNLTFNMSDSGAQFKFDLVQDAFLHGRSISGYVDGCGSSNINRLSQVSVF